MMWTLIAGYERRETAARAVGHLIEMGVAPEDISLVTPVSGSEECGHVLHLVDAGRAGLPRTAFRRRMEEEGVEGLESAVGAGIATVDPADDVSGPEEMDDASSVAENMASPLSERWYGQDEEHDALVFAEEGTIDATAPRTASFADLHPDRDLPETPPVSAIALPGGMGVLGDGSLATGLVAERLQEPEIEPAQAVAHTLWKLGASPALAKEFGTLYGDGGAVLTVAKAPGAIPVQVLEETVLWSGARQASTFVEVSLA